MRVFALVLGLLAGPVQAMTAEDCKQLQSSLSKTIAAVAEIRLAPSVTEDGWCRVIDGPLGAGLEWRYSSSGKDFTFAVRQDDFAFDGMGPFELSGEVQAFDGKALLVGPFRFNAKTDESAVVSAAFGPLLGSNGLDAETLALQRAAFTVTGRTGLIDEILGWAFRQDLTAARSSFIAARDQRKVMQDWLDEVASPVIEKDAARDFEALVQAYPRARGTAQIAVQEGSSLQVGGLISALLFGAPFSRGEAAKLVEEAGLRFTWQPD